jgi:NTP pyrophosphatase (non-canonical NTP hydrolase)
MHLGKYQTKAATSAGYPFRFAVVYPAIGLAGECGEVVEIIKKAVRRCHSRDVQDDLSEAELTHIAEELGDVLWYVAALATDLGLDLDIIAAANLDKLARRHRKPKRRITLHSGPDSEE